MRRIVLTILVLGALVGSVFTAAPAAAAHLAAPPPAAQSQTHDAGTTTGAIEVLASSGRSDFPSRIVFNLQAKSSAQISSVRIAYRVGDDPVTSIARVTVAPAFRIDASYQIDLSREYYPPGVTMHYRWQIEDQSGAQLTTSWTDLRITDPRFFWHERTLGAVTLHWYEGNDQYADTLLSTAARALATASSTMGTASPKPVDIYLYASEQDFRSALVAGSDQWVGGQTYPLYRLTVLLAPPDQLADDQRSVAHEMTHIAIDSTAEDPFGPLPTWLDEGVAMVAEGPLDPTFQQALASAAASHHLLSIQSISGNFPEDSDQAALAYAESASLVSYFEKQYGPQKLAALIAAFRQGETSDEAFQQTIGMPTREFQQRWEASLQSLGAAATPTPSTRASANQQTGSPSLISILLTPVTFVISLLESIARLLRASKG
jgi:hypothetical protein